MRHFFISASYFASFTRIDIWMTRRRGEGEFESILSMRWFGWNEHDLAFISFIRKLDTVSFTCMSFHGCALLLSSCLLILHLNRMRLRQLWNDYSFWMGNGLKRTSYPAILFLNGINSLLSVLFHIHSRFSWNVSSVLLFLHSCVRIVEPWLMATLFSALNQKTATLLRCVVSPKGTVLHHTIVLVVMPVQNIMEQMKCAKECKLQQTSILLVG